MFKHFCCIHRRLHRVCWVCFSIPKHYAEAYPHGHMWSRSIPCIHAYIQITDPVSLPHHTVLMRFSSSKMHPIQNFTGFHPIGFWEAYSAPKPPSWWGGSRCPSPKTSPLLSTLHNSSVSPYPYFVPWHRLWLWDESYSHSEQHRQTSWWE